MNYSKKKMRLLITGSTGMVGRNLLENLDLPEFDILNPIRKELNLLDYSSVNEYIKNNKPDFIVHAAGKVGGIQANIANPVSFLIENMDMGRNIILAAKSNSVKNFINLSSSCMYPRYAKNPLSEEMILKGELEPTNEGYAIAKIMSTRLCEYVNLEDNTLNYKTIIPCNLFGRHDNFDAKNSHMLPAVVKKIHEAKINNQSFVEIWGDGTARREFMYAGDLADFIIYAIKNFSEMPQNINVGLGYDYSIYEYYQVIAKEIGYTGNFKYDLTKPVGMKQKLIDNKKLNRFGWRPKTSMEDGIKNTYKFYLENKINE